MPWHKHRPSLINRRLAPGAQGICRRQRNSENPVASPSTTRESRNHRVKHGTIVMARELQKLSRLNKGSLLLRLHEESILRKQQPVESHPMLIKGRLWHLKVFNSLQTNPQFQWVKKKKATQQWIPFEERGNVSQYTEGIGSGIAILPWHKTGKINLPLPEPRSVLK